MFLVILIQLKSVTKISITNIITTVSKVFLSSVPSKILCKPPESQKLGHIALPIFTVGILLISIIREASEKHILLALDISNDVF